MSTLALESDTVGSKRIEVDRRDGGAIAILAAICYLPLFLTKWGILDADTKLYLYLDPAGLLRSAPDLWNPAWSGGTVTHQNIGYLWPMGPYYLLTDVLGIPDWVAQRFWFGSILFAAASGAYVCFRALWGDRLAATAGALAFGLSPFVLGHITGQSALLLPFVALPWLVWCVRNALRGSAWRWSAIAALITTTAGALNGSSIFFVLLGALLWIPFAVWRERSASARDGVRVLIRLVLLIVITQLWWLVAYQIGGKYGQPILDVTETVNQTSTTTSAVEVLRGLGYWFFYGGDHLGPWLSGLAPAFTQNVILIAISFGIPMSCLVFGWLARARERGYFVASIVVGMLLSTVAFGGPDRAPAGSLFESLSRHSGLILSLRNTQRATALVAFGLAGLGACGIAALRDRSARVGSLVGSLVAVLAVLTFVVPWRSGLIPDRYQRPERIPQAWIDAARHLDEVGGRTLLLPGIDFGAYRWGHTLDPVLPGLTRSQVIWREQLPMGGRPGADLLAAFDEALQTGQLDPAAIVPVAQALGVEHIVVAGDLEWDRYRIVRPEVVLAKLEDPAAGLRLAATFNDGYVNEPPSRPAVDDRSLDDPPPMPIPQVAIFDVPGVGHEPVGAIASGAETILHGDGSGIVGAAAAGLVDSAHVPLLLASELANWSAARDMATSATARHVVTDTARRSVHRFFTLTANDGATLSLDGRPHSGLASDTTSTSLSDDARAQSVAVITGARWVDATGYGDTVRLLPEDRPVNAFDGDPTTAWRIDTGYFRALRGSVANELSIDLGRQVDAGHIAVVQSDAVAGTQPITQFEVVLDHERTIPVAVDPAHAFESNGTLVDLDGMPFTTLSIRIPDDPELTRLIAISDVKIPEVRVEEIIRMPLTLADHLSPTDPPRVAWLMDRQRVDAGDTTRVDPEMTMIRSFDVPRSTPVNLTGVVRLDGRASDDVVDAAAGRTSGITATSSGHLLGDPSTRASSAIDGIPSTAWVTPLDGAIGASWTGYVPGGFSLSELPIDLVVDGRHSVPTRFVITVDGVSQTVEVPMASTIDGVRRVVLRPTKPLVGERVTLAIAAVDASLAVDATGTVRSLPAAVAEVELGSPSTGRSDHIEQSGCRDDLFTLDGDPISVRLGAPVADRFLSRSFTTCDGGPIALDAGVHILRTSNGHVTGLSVDRVMFVSPSFENAPAVTDLGPAPKVEDSSSGRANISGSGAPYWVRLDQSSNPGWSAAAKWSDGSIDLGRAHTLDGFAAGWLMDANVSGESRFSFIWKPQKYVDLALLISALGVVACVAIAILTRRRHGERDMRRPRVARSPLALSKPSVTASLIAVVVAGAFGGLALGVAVAAFAVAAALARRSRLFDALTRSVPLLAIALGIALVVARQFRHRFIHDVLWPGHFVEAHRSVLFGVICLALLMSADDERDAPPVVSPSPTESSS